VKRGRRTLVPLPGTRPARVAGARATTAPRSRRRLTLTLRLRSREKRLDLLSLFRGITSGSRPPLRRDEFTARFGVARSDIVRVRQFARAHGFRVGRIWIAERRLHLSGPVSALADAFGVRRVVYRDGAATWASYTGRVCVPRELAGCVIGVYGFNERAQANRGAAAAAATPTATARPRVSYTPPEVGAIYGFPAGVDGRGQTIGVVALGGGYAEADLRGFFTRLRIRKPRYVSISVDGARNAPFGSTKSFDGEVTGDIQTIGALAPGARVAVYFAPNTARGFLDAVSAAVHDPKQQITVLSVSWGQAEVHFARRTLEAFNDVLLEAAVLGVTVCCASGDHGAFAATRDRVPHVTFPASSPYVLACGGTTLVAKRKRIVSETVWHNQTGASGGGVSTLFPLPSWQRRVRVPTATNRRRGRGVPDVASNADPRTGFRIFGRGAWHVGAGTSAAAPVWAALIARINQVRGLPVGLVTPFLYGHYPRLLKDGAIRKIKRGNNGTFRAQRGWDRCTGLGVPDGTKLANAIQHPKPAR